jgi:Fe-S cluster biogenesis protein NfuA
MAQTTEEKIKEVIELIRPNLRMDGGDIEFVALEDKTVKVRLRGACCGCPASQVTLKQGVERIIREKVPEVEKVVSV